jgi:hypothetical protein
VTGDGGIVSGKLAESTAAQVRGALTIVEQLGLEIATSDDAQRILQLKDGRRWASKRAKPAGPTGPRNPVVFVLAFQELGTETIERMRVELPIDLAHVDHGIRRDPELSGDVPVR